MIVFIVFFSETKSLETSKKKVDKWKTRAEKVVKLQDGSSTEGIALLLCSKSVADDETGRVYDCCAARIFLRKYIVYFFGNNLKMKILN